MSHGPGTIVLPCQELARYHRFTMSLGNVEKPEGSQVVLGVGMSITDNLNTAVRSLRPQDEWIWLLGDDHVFDPDTLMRLLDREEDIIAPVCSYRFAPFGLVHYGDRIGDTEFFKQLQVTDLPTDGEPFEVVRSGSLMLIRRHVLDAIGDPWWGHANWRMSEDMYFCEQARAKGFKIMVDPSVSVGHMGNFTAVPVQKDGVWGILLDFGFGFSQFLEGGANANDAAMGKLEPALA